MEAENKDMNDLIGWHRASSEDCELFEQTLLSLLDTYDGSMKTLHLAIRKGLREGENKTLNPRDVSRLLVKVAQAFYVDGFIYGANTALKMEKQGEPLRIDGFASMDDEEADGLFDFDVNPFRSNS